MPQWGYDPKSKRYRNLATGRYVSYNQVIDWAYAYAAKSGDVAAYLGSQVARGALRIQDWQAIFRQEIKKQFINQYLAGKGGLAQMAPRDWGALGHLLRDQYRHLDGFAADIASGKLSEAQIQARSRMYIDAAHQAFERGRAEAFTMPTLPAYPGDGQTRCLTHCHCNWIIEEVFSGNRLAGWNATWRLSPAEHCPDCPANAKLWAPLWVPAGMSPAEAAAWRAAEIHRMLASRG